MEYTIQPGDNFYHLSRRNGGSWQEYVGLNPGIDPCNLTVGTRVIIPDSNNYNKVTSSRCDDVVIDVEGLRIRVLRLGETKIPHEAHVIIPQTEVHKIECPAKGTIETRIVISNISIVNSPYHSNIGNRQRQLPPQE